MNTQLLLDPRIEGRSRKKITKKKKRKEKRKDLIRHQ